MASAQRPAKSGKGGIQLVLNPPLPVPPAGASALAQLALERDAVVQELLDIHRSGSLPRHQKEALERVIGTLEPSIPATALSIIQTAKESGITILDLSKEGLTHVPAAVLTLTNLERLDLHSNQLTALPDALSALTNLERLDLRDNQLTALPDSLSALTNLTELNLHSNKLAAVPDSLSALTNLERLYLGQNPLSGEDAARHAQLLARGEGTTSVADWWGLRRR